MTNKEAMNLKAGDKIVCIQDHLIKRIINKQIFTPGKYYTINNVIEYMESDKDEYNELYPLTEIFVTDDYGVIRSTKDLIGFGNPSAMSNHPRKYGSRTYRPRKLKTGERIRNNYAVYDWVTDVIFSKGTTYEIVWASIYNKNYISAKDNYGNLYKDINVKIFDRLSENRKKKLDCLSNKMVE